MPNINLSILNQKATPAFFADTFANRPAASFVGRVFISTDTLDLYRDTGTAWVLLSPSSSGTIGGSGTTDTIPLFTASSSIGNSAITQQTAAQSITIGSFATPFNVIGYGNYYGSQFIINGGLATQILAANGSTITAGTGISISAGQISATSSGTITGGGNATYIPLWTGGTAIGDSALIQITGTADLFIGSLGVPYDVIGYGTYSGTKFIINGGLNNQILVADGTTITAGTGISISAGQISATGSGGVTGTGAINQVSFWNSATSITGTNNFFWDSTNNHLGINTSTPGTALDIHHNQNTIIQLNQTTFGNDNRIAFQNSGITNWRIGNFYSFGLNDFAVQDASLSINRLTIKSSTGQTFVGTDTTSSGLLVVNNSASDQHLVVLGASAPSIRVRNAGSAATQQFGFGLATTINNFIQGTTGGEMCIFNDSTTAQPIVFGIANFGLTNEVGRFASNGNFGLGTTSPGYSATNRKVLAIQGGSNFGEGAILGFMQGGTNKGYVYSVQNDMEFWCESGAMTIGNAQTFDVTIKTNNINRFIVKGSGVINIQNIPTSSFGLVTGDIYSNGGILTIV